MSLVDLAVESANLLIWSATTVKPRPCSPARAASMEAFTASKFVWSAISVLAEIMKIQHGLELLETQGAFALSSYLEKVQKDGYDGKTKAGKNIVADANFKSALIKTRSMAEKGFQHPKLIT